MAISPDIESGPFIGNGTQAAFAFTFTAISPGEVVVELDGVTQSGGFNVTLADNGGTVTFAAPPASGVQVVLRSSPDYLQDSVFENEGAYNLATVNTINRRQAVRALVASDKAERAIKAPIGDAADMTLAPASARADKLLGFGPLGDGAKPAAFDISAAALETLAASNGDIVLLADHIDAIAGVAANLSGSDTIGTVAADIANIAAVGGAITAVNAVADDLSIIDAVAGNATNITAAAGNASNINAVAGNATNVNAVAAITANVTQVATDHAALVAVANDLANIDAVATNLPAVNAVVSAAVTLGVYPGTAHVGGNIPKGAISFSFTAGSGGTNSVNNVATFTGGTLTYNPRILYDVVGGVLTNVRMLFGGLYIGSSTPTMPTVVLANGGSGTVTLVGGLLYAVGQSYWAVSADGRTLDSIVNTAGAPASNSANVPSLYLKPAVDELFNAGGARNYFPDPFFTSTSLTGGFTPAVSDPPFLLSGAWDPISDASSLSPYPSGKMLNRPSGNVSGPPAINLYLDNMGLVAGDVIQISQELFFTDGFSATSGSYCDLLFRNRSGTNIGSSVSVLTATSGNPLNGTCKQWNSGSLTIPAGCGLITLNYAQISAHPRAIVSLQVVKVVNGNVAPAKPVQRLPAPDAANRLALLETHDPGNLRNGVLMRRSTYASASTSYPVGTTGFIPNSFSNTSGMGQSYLAAACPAPGFNVITTPLTWTPSATTGPARIEAIVRTCATGGNPLVVGKTIAWGYIDVDPTAGTAGSEPIQLFDPVSGLPKTVMPSDLLDLMGIAVVSVNSQGSNNPPTQLFVSSGPQSNADPALPGFQAPGVPGGVASAWVINVGANPFVPQLTLAVSPVTAMKTPSATFASAVATLVDEPPLIIALPKTVYCVVGREASVYYDAVQQRDAKRTNFTAAWSGAVPSGMGGLEERIKYVPASATTNTLTLNAFRGDLFSSSATCAFVSVAASAAAGTKVVHCLGDSLIENGGMMNALRAISLEAGSVTSLTFIGSKGTAPLLNDGYSGKPLGAFRSATIVGTNPFYNPSATDFDYAYWMANTGSGFAPADFVFIEAGGVDVGAPITDAAAQAAAATWATTAEFIAASIHAANPTAKIIFYTKEAGPVPGQMPAPDPSASYGPIWRIRRNWRILAAKQISQFGNRASDSIYVSPTAAAIDPEAGWGRLFQPRDAAVTYNQTTYATYAAMVADLTKGNKTLAYATDVDAWFVKVGGAGLGRWRDARLEDGFIMRHVDTVHYANGALQVAEANWAVIKALG